ncbi:MAG TPA: insulinase family protein, partial [Candidatus Acidoferrales bacterium]|nr:insulinase family protein [Candidatus Acidoferrales bacterium]
MRSKASFRISMHAAATIFLAATIALSGWSQAPTADDKSIPTSKVERMNRAPVSKDILKVKLPRPVETTLPNGISLMILEDHRFPLVTVMFDISGAGPMYEPAAQPGLAGATARLLAEGTKTRTSKQIAEQIDSLGASLSASAGFGSSSAIVSASGLSDKFDE